MDYHRRWYPAGKDAGSGIKETVFMQKGAAGKKKPVIVTKPILNGRAVDGNTFKRALKVAGGILVAVFIYFVFGSILLFQNIILRILTNSVILAICGGFLYMSGASQGEADAAFGEIMHQRVEEGKTVPDSDRARSFTPIKGICTALLGASPFVLLCLAAALTAVLQTYSLGALPDWTASYRRQPEIGDALLYYVSTASIAVIDIVHIAVRMLMLPFVSMVGAGNANAVLLVERLSPLLVLVVPAGYTLGYMKGKSLRSRVHTSIAQSKRKKKNRDKKERQRRQQKGPEQLI
jgi:hypothetical protein